MNPTSNLLKKDITSGTAKEHELLKGKPPGVKLDIVNECQMFIKAEDGGGDAHLHLKDNKKGESENPASTSDQYNTTDSDNCNSNPEYDVDGVPDLPEDGLPDTVSILDGPDGGKVYLVGTAHFSVKSQDDVARVIREVQPHIVMVELCEQRTNILLLDEEIILREAKSINLRKIRNTIKQNGMINGIMYILLLNMSAHFTRELGMAPGGEFRRAMTEARRIPNCHIHLGDRAINVTLQRAIASLSWLQTFRFIWHLLTSSKSVTAEEVEKCKQKKMLDEMLEEMAEDFPTLKHVFVAERDMYLCHSLTVAAHAVNKRHQEPCRIVGVVGIGHVGGIVENWGKIRPEDIPPLLIIPPPTRSTRVLRITVRIACASAIIYTVYKLIPKRWFS